MNPSARRTAWVTEISNREAKQAVAKKIADLVKHGDVVGAGSGSTAFLALGEIARRVREEDLRCTLIPTSRETQLAANAYGLTTTSLLEMKPHWCFDGADEVDADGNLIKGRGGALYREKLVMRASQTAYILVDAGKFVQRLGEKFPVPVEILPEALHYVESEILRFEGFESSEVRPAKGKEGPIITENGNVILDVRLQRIDAHTELRLKSITGVLESGLFWGFQPQILSQ